MCNQTEIYTIESGQKDVSSLEGTTKNFFYFFDNYRNCPIIQCLTCFSERQYETCTKIRECLFRSFNVVAVQLRGSMVAQPQIKCWSTYPCGCVAAKYLFYFINIKMFHILGLHILIWLFQCFRRVIRGVITGYIQQGLGFFRGFGHVGKQIRIVFPATWPCGHNMKTFKQTLPKNYPNSGIPKNLRITFVGLKPCLSLK